MEFFQNAKAVRLKSAHKKYLTADEDEETVIQDRNGSSKCAKWVIEFVENSDGVIRLKSCYGKYLTASNHQFLLGMTGRKVTQTLPKRLDSSVEWEPVKVKGRIQLRTRYGQYMRANGGLPPWRNSVTHDIPHSTMGSDDGHILWEVHVVEILDAQYSPVEKPAPPVQVVERMDSGSFSSSPAASFNSSSRVSSFQSSPAASFSKLPSNGSSVTFPPKATTLPNVLRYGSTTGRLVYYRIANENGEIDNEFEELCITFKGNGVEELKKRLEEELEIYEIDVCTTSPLNGKLCPLWLQLPPNNATMHVVILPPSS